LRDLNRSGQTIIHVTHDYEEAIALGNRIAVMNSGAIEQMGTPEEIFTKPASSFVASFGGVRNFFPASLSPAKEQDLVRAKLKENVTVFLYSDDLGDGYISFPESSVTISESPSPSSALNTFKGVIADIYPQRHGFEVVVSIGVSIFASLTRESVSNLNLKQGKEVWVSFKASGVRFIPKI
jgi:molybdopterin-binding protein